jgi:acyl-CoA synthetase (AMP-forming)/AMP-acid ligase II
VPVLPDQLRWTAERHPQAVAFQVHGVGELTAQQWHEESSRLARGMVAHGVRPDDRVALLIEPADGLAFVLAYVATHKAGAVAVPLNVRLTAPEVARLLEHCDPSVVIASTATRSLVPAGRRVLDVSTWAEWFDADGSDLQVPRGAEDVAEILYTSGTTGIPKGVEIEHGNSALQVLSRPDWTGGAWLHCSPMSTFAGLAFVYAPMRMGLRTLFVPRFDPATWLEIVAKEQPVAAFLVPAMVQLLLAHPALATADLSSLYVMSIGSAPIAPSTLLRLQEHLPNASVTNSYSMTEAGTTYCVMPKGELALRPGSVGKPLPPAEIRVVDTESLEPVPAGTMGEVVIKPAGKPRRYYRDEEATTALYAGEWLRSGDLGHFDADGYLYITGRAKDVIIRGGNNVHAVDVENVLFTHPDVQEAAVAAVPHDVLGEDVGAWVVLKQGATATPEQLIAHCREQLADQQDPSGDLVVGELPRNATGKVLKRALTDSVALAQ